MLLRLRVNLINQFLLLNRQSSCLAVEATCISLVLWKLVFQKYFSFQFLKLMLSFAAFYFSLHSFGVHLRIKINQVRIRYCIICFDFFSLMQPYGFVENVVFFPIPRAQLSLQRKLHLNHINQHDLHLLD